MHTLVITDADHPDFIGLTRQLDDLYYAIYGEIALAYRQYNTPEGVVCAALVYFGEQAVGCGAIRRFDDETVELKRVFVLKPHRRRGLAELLVNALEAQAVSRGFGRVVLETGADMEPAQALYKKLGYCFTDNFGAFAGDALCVCMEKRLPSR